MKELERRYDERGNEIYYNDGRGTEIISEYDENNNLIRTKDSNGFETIAEYDEENRLTLYKNSLGTEYHYWYHEDGSSKVKVYRRGKLISTTYYDKDDNVTHCYDERGNLVFHKDGDHSESLAYDEDDRLIITRDSNDKSVKYEYNENDTLAKVIESVKGKKTKEIIYEYEGTECIRSTDIFYNEDGTVRERIIHDEKEEK